MLLQLADRQSKVLRSPTKLLEAVTPITKQFTGNMLDTMKAYEGVGLAANQVGSEFRIAVIQAKGIRNKPLVLINPEITSISDKTYDSAEGCLSLPKETHLVRRPEWVCIKYLDQNGKEQTLKAKHALARIVMHELDHLDGIVIDTKEYVCPKPQNLPTMKS